jgi:hypothetical protein
MGLYDESVVSGLTRKRQDGLAASLEANARKVGIEQRFKTLMSKYGDLESPQGLASSLVQPRGRMSREQELQGLSEAERLGAVDDLKGYSESNGRGY